MYREIVKGVTWSAVGILKDTQCAKISVYDCLFHFVIYCATHAKLLICLSFIVPQNRSKNVHSEKRVTAAQSIDGMDFVHIIH